MLYGDSLCSISLAFLAFCFLESQFHELLSSTSAVSKLRGNGLLTDGGLVPVSIWGEPVAPANSPRSISPTLSQSPATRNLQLRRLRSVNAPSSTDHSSALQSMSSYFPSSQQSSAANSPPRGRPISGQTPRIDGKEFFRHARSRLSYEQLSAFLANVKEFNTHRQSREDPLKKAEEIFGQDNKDLYLLFQGLLNRSAR